MAVDQTQEAIELFRKRLDEQLDAARDKLVEDYTAQLEAIAVAPPHRRRRRGHLPRLFDWVGASRTPAVQDAPMQVVIIEGDCHPVPEGNVAPGRSMTQATQSEKEQSE